MKKLQSSLEEHNKIRNLFQLADLNINIKDLPESYVIHGHLRRYSPPEAQRPLKLRAEKNFCEIVALGLSPLIFILPFLDSLTGIAKWKFLAILVIAVILLTLRGIRLHRYFVGSTFRAWLEYSFPIHSNLDGKTEK